MRQVCKHNGEMFFLRGFISISGISVTFHNSEYIHYSVGINISHSLSIVIKSIHIGGNRRAGVYGGHGQVAYFVSGWIWWGVGGGVGEGGDDDRSIGETQSTPSLPFLTSPSRSLLL